MYRLKDNSNLHIAAKFHQNIPNRTNVISLLVRPPTVFDGSKTSSATKHNKSHFFEVPPQMVVWNQTYVCVRHFGWFAPPTILWCWGLNREAGDRPFTKTLPKTDFCQKNLTHHFQQLLLICYEWIWKYLTSLWRDVMGNPSSCKFFRLNLELSFWLVFRFCGLKCFWSVEK